MKNEIYIDEIMKQLENEELFDYEAGCFGGDDTYTSKNGRVTIYIGNEIHNQEVDSIEIDDEELLNECYLLYICIDIWNKVLDAIK